VGINALVLFMFSQVQDTELGLVVKHVKILVFDVIVDQLCLNFFLAMGIRAELSIRAFRYGIGPMGAETFAVVLGVVLFLDWRMCLKTNIS